MSTLDINVCLTHLRTGAVTVTEGLEVVANVAQTLVHDEDSLIECKVTAQPPPATYWEFDANYINPLGK